MELSASKSNKSSYNRSLRSKRESSTKDFYFYEPATELPSEMRIEQQQDDSSSQVLKKLSQIENNLVQNLDIQEKIQKRIQEVRSQIE